MTICGNRNDTPGFFTTCRAALGRPCACAADIEADHTTEGDRR